MGEGPATVPSLRHTRDGTHEAEFSGRGGSEVFSTALSLNPSVPAYSICPCSHSQSIPRLLLLAALISLILLGVQFLVSDLPPAAAALHSTAVPCCRFTHLLRWLCTHCVYHAG